MLTFLIYALSVTFGVFLLYFLGVALAPYQPDPVKDDHFECGLPAFLFRSQKSEFWFFCLCHYVYCCRYDRTLFSPFLFIVKVNTHL